MELCVCTTGLVAGRKDGCLPMGILRKALEITLYFLELLGRNGFEICPRFPPPFQHPLAHSPGRPALLFHVLPSCGPKVPRKGLSGCFAQYHICYFG